MLKHTTNTAFKMAALLIIALSMPGCGGEVANKISEEIVNSDSDTGTTETPQVEISGKAIKGVIANAAVSIYSINKGLLTRELLGTSQTNSHGEFTVKIPKKNAHRLLYMELTANTSPNNPSTMICDAYTGCGTINGETVDFGDTFALNDNFLLRNVVKSPGNETFIPAHFSPLRHMVVAQIESGIGNFKSSSLDAARLKVAQLFSLQTPINKLTPVDLTTDKETLDIANDEEIIAAIIDASFLKIGRESSFMPVEQALNTLTQQGGGFSDEDSEISSQKILRAAELNVPEVLSDRDSIDTFFENTAEAPTQFSFDVDTTGSGSVTSADNSINCSTSNCDYRLEEGISVSLTATADQGHKFDGWSGACSGNASTCEFTLSANTQVTAAFSEIVIEPTTYALDISITNSGSVRDFTNNFTCNKSNCENTYNEGSRVTITASPDTGFEFDHWTGQCSNRTAANCTFIMSRDRSVTAVFKAIVREPTTYALNVSITSSGSVRDSANDFTCSESNCENTYEEGSSVTLNARPDTGFEFDHWSGQCSNSTAANCTFTMSGNRSATAVFKEIEPTTYALNVSITNSGSVRDSANDFTCSESNCENTYEEDSSVTLNARPDSGFEFDHWSGQCSNSTAANCTFTMSGNRSATAVFKEIEPTTYALNVSITSSGSVRDSANDFTCSESNCENTYEEGSSVTLNARPDSGFEFDHWSGQCSNSTAASCTFTMSGNRSATAVFKEIEATTYALNVSITSSGSVRDSANDFNCSESNCENTYEEGSSVTLNANPDSGFEFDHWSGQCSNSTETDCTFTMSRDRSVTAVFKAIPQDFSLNIIITGSGSVQNIANGIDCNANCSSSILEDTTVPLMATAASGYDFSHWSVSCNNSSDAECAVTMSSNISITAVFIEEEATTGSITVNWTAPTEREDGEAFAANEIARYVVYYRESTSPNYEGAAFINVTDEDGNGVPTSQSIPDLEIGKTYYIAAVTIDSNGLTSQLSNEIQRAVQ